MEISPHPRPWHRDSIFGEGPRRPLDRERRARWTYLVHAHTRAGRIAPKGEWALLALLWHLSRDGRCDPSYACLADGNGFCAKTAERAVRAASACGLLGWQRRIVRVGSRVTQTSNAYELLIPGDVEPHPRSPIRATPSRANFESIGSSSTLSIATNVPPAAGDLAARCAANVAADKLKRRLRVARLFGRA